MLFVFVNTIVLTVIFYLVVRGEHRPSTSGLLGLPLGLSIIALMSSLFLGTIEFIGKFHFIAAFAVSVLCFRWAFDIPMKQSLLVCGIWMAWLVLYPIVASWL